MVHERYHEHEFPVLENCGGGVVVVDPLEGTYTIERHSARVYKFRSDSGVGVTRIVNIVSPDPSRIGDRHIIQNDSPLDALAIQDVNGIVMVLAAGFYAEFWSDGTTNHVIRHTEGAGGSVVAKDQIWSYGFYDVWGIDTDKAETNGAGCVGDIQLVEQADAYAVCYSSVGAAYAVLSNSSSLVGYTLDYQLFSDNPPAANDACYFGAAHPFPELAFDIDIAATYSAPIPTGCLWHYWDGAAWQPLTIAHDGTDSIGGPPPGTYAFLQDGAISFDPPDDWAPCDVNGTTAYWIRASVDPATTMTGGPTTNGKNHELVIPDDGAWARENATINSIRVCDGSPIAVTHSTAPTEFILVNYTQWLFSDVLSWPQTRRQYQFDNIDMPVDEGDVIGVLVLAEDGNNEVTMALVECYVTLT